MPLSLPPSTGALFAITKISSSGHEISMLATIMCYCVAFHNQSLSIIPAIACVAMSFQLETNPTIICCVIFLGKIYNYSTEEDVEKNCYVSLKDGVKWVIFNIKYSEKESAPGRVRAVGL